MTDALVIGAGPAGLMAAEMLADAGHSVTVADGKPSVGRKFLMAGKSGLNLTKSEPFADFIAAFGSAADWLKPSIEAFDNTAVIDWAQGLDQDTFIGSTRRVFPKAMKASPLLRAWLNRLSDKGVTFQTRWRWVEWTGGIFIFETPNGLHSVTPKATVLALGGASWARLGSDGMWTDILAQRGIDTAPFEPSNMGITVDWSDHMAPLFGAPLKNIAMTVGNDRRKGECVLSKSGLEGSLVYQFSTGLRSSEPMQIDLLPDQTTAALQARIDKQSTKTSLANILRKSLKLDAVKSALVMEFARATPRDALAQTVKSLPIPYTGTAPLDLAISVAGGVRQTDLTADFMLASESGSFCAGEMLDWEAPTGGYLITACLATGRTAGRAAADYIKRLS
ncbi:TIGR03862 family flavoprotein [Amylibacter sp. IMCC11727]|uniref:TIGR03862 family flavoprotein n=1 Tax=Amylibacter sp. IMCC11727 TaxID=3039851 RepID=UPI00244E1111|nr:TIGR03862 family flavoprotein [Amylibacter sp. IMCC11727]WGI22232.1 TIGR03862 family flavoprotein [Amylibacter sp. IMCC11727]